MASIRFFVDDCRLVWRERRAYGAVDLAQKVAYGHGRRRRLRIAIANIARSEIHLGCAGADEFQKVAVDPRLLRRQQSLLPLLEAAHRVIARSMKISEERNGLKQAPARTLRPENAF